MNFRGFLHTAEAIEEENAPQVDTSLPQPPTCSYCGSPEFDGVEDNGRVQRARCSACGGTMVSHGGAWMPDLIGSPHNHSRPDGDPASGDVGGAGNAPVVLQTNDLDQRTAGFWDPKSNWSEHGYETGPIHRGLALHGPISYELSEPESLVSDGAPHAEVAHSILRHVSQQPLGMSWTSDHDHARRVAEDGGWHTEQRRGFPVVLHAAQPNPEHIEHDEHVLRRNNVTPHGDTESEVPLKRGAPARITGVSWKPPLIGWRERQAAEASPDKGWVTHHFEGPMTHTAAGPDWCRHRHAEHCWLPNREARGPVALYPPQDRGICPWKTANQQQINCPMSEAGPMAGMTRAAMLLHLAYGDRVGALLPVSHAGYRGHVEAYPGHEHEMNEMDREINGGHESFDYDVWDEHAPEPNTHERAYHQEHDELPDEYHERHQEAYDKAVQKRYEDTQPIGHHTPLVNFVRSHGDDHQFWHDHGRLEDIDHAHQSVIATQPYLVQKHLDRYMKNRDDDVDHVQQHGWGEHNVNYIGSHHPMVVRHEGNLYATEGHHRMASDMMSGRKTRAFVFDADRYGGFPKPKDGEEPEYHAEHSGLQRYAKADYCDYHIKDDKKRRSHEVRHHDDGVCTLTEHKRHREQQRKHKKTSAAGPVDSELGFHMVATWADVRRKAKRIRAEGGVSIVVASGDGVGGHVQGDTGIYETILNYAPGSYRVANWTCGCAWAAYAWDRSPAYRRFEGRMCSHALALQYEAQSRGMFGREVHEDRVSPSWMRDKVRQRYDRDSGVHDLVHASRSSDPDGVYPVGHGLDLDRPPLYAFAIVSTVFGQDPAETIGHMLRHGMDHATAQALLHEAIDHVRANEVDWARVEGERAKISVVREGALPGPAHETHCPDCGAAISSTADRCPKCGADLREGDTGDQHLASNRVNMGEVVSEASAKAPTAKGEGEPPSEPTHAGVVLKAADTGRVLMIQRSHKDLDDPARGTWEFPGGGREPHDAHSLHSGIREFEEETGHPFPTGGHVSHVWQSPNGVYQGHVVVVPSEDAIDFSGGRSTVNPDDPDGDDHEQSAWWDPDHARKNPALREECRSSPWRAIKAASLQREAVLPTKQTERPCPNCGRSMPQGQAACPDCGQHQEPHGERTATYSANEGLTDPEIADFRPKPPPRPLDGSQENPASTGFATAGDPPEFDQQLSTRQQTTPFAAVLHEEPEPALPSTEADDEALETPGARYRSQMSPAIDTGEQSMVPQTVHGSMQGAETVEEIIAAFQATAAGQKLAGSKGVSTVDIASAARAFLSGDPTPGGGIAHTALKDFSYGEQQELIQEGAADGRRARNFGDLKIEGTHYESLDRALAATDVDHSDDEDLFV